MFRRVVQGFTNAATKPGCLGPFQRSLQQQESALPNAYESNDRNVTGLSYKKNTTKVQQLETFSTQYTGVSKFLLGKIPAGRSSGIAKPPLGGDVQFKKLGDTARLNPALCYSEGQSVGFGASQQTVKNILAEGEKSDILSGIWGLTQNPINNSFREGEMHANTSKQHIENSQEEQLHGKNKLKSQIKELNGRVTKLAEEEKDQLDKDLNSAKQDLAEKDKELEDTKSQLEKLKQDLSKKTEEFKNKQAQLTEKEGEVDKLNDQVAQLAWEKKQFKEEFDGIKAQLASKDEKISELNGQVTKLTEEKNQLDKNLNSANQALNEKDKELKNKAQQLKALESTSEKLKDENKGLKTKLQEFEKENEELESKIQKLEELKSAYESQIKGLQKELEDNKDSKPSAVNAQGVKSKVNYVSASFILSGVCAVGASLATPYLAICAILAVAASVFLALGCHCLYKANTALSDVKVQQDSQLLLEK